MRKLCIIVTGLCCTLLFTTCKQYSADIENDLSYWSAIVTARDVTCDKPSQINTSGAMCIPSATDAAFTLKVRNPKNFTLVTPTSSADAVRVIRFPHLSPPPKPTAVLAQTNVVAPLQPTYVLRLQVPDMGISVPSGKLHGDIAQIEINGIEYPLELAPLPSPSHFVVRPTDTCFITATAVQPITEPVPAGNWVLYYDTGLAVGQPYRAYTVKLKDNKGLVSQTLETGTARPQLAAETVTVTKGEQGSGSGASGSTPIIINGAASAPEAQITIAHGTPGTTVHCTIQEVVGGSVTGSVSPYNGNPVNVPLGLHGATEKLYKVEYHTEGTGYTPSSTTTKYYKVLKCYNVTFNANNGAFPGGLAQYTVRVPHGTFAAVPSGTNEPSRTGYHVAGWYKETAHTTQWNFTSDTVINDITLYAKWTANPYTVQFNGNGHTGGSMLAQMFRYDQSQALTPNNFNKTGYTFDGWARSAGGSKMYTNGQSVSNLTVVKDDTVTLYAKWTANTYKVKFNSNGGSGTAMSDQTFTYGVSQNLKLNTFSKTGHDFLGWSKTSGATTATYNNQASVNNLTTTNGEIVNLYAVWKVKTYKVKFCVEGGKGSLTASGQTATDSTLKEISVNHGSNVSFTASPTTGWNIADWSVSSGGTLSNSTSSPSRTLSNVTADRTVKVTFYTKNLTHDNATWKDLLNAVKYAPSGSTLTIHGEIKATTAPGNHGEIKINKNLTIKEIDSHGFTTIINANNLSRIFNIEAGTLTMEHLNLQNGKSSDNGAGIFVNSGASLELKNSCVIKDCVSSANGGGIYMAGTCSVLLEDSVINKCIAKKGGGVYVPNGNTFKMKGRTAISIDCNDDSDKDKNAVYLENTAKINISAGNNGYAVGGSMIVRIIPQSYTVREVLTGTITDGNPTNHTRFMVKPNSQYWFVDNTGKLSNNTSSFFNDAYKDLIKSHEPLMKPARIPGRTELLNKMLLYKTSEGNFGIMQITQANSATGPIMFNYKTYNSYGSPLKSENNITVNGTHDFDLDTGLGTGRVDFWLQNATSTEVYLTPKNGAQFYLMP